MASKTQRQLNCDLFSGKYRQRIVKDKKNDYKRHAKHKNRQYEGGYFLSVLFNLIWK